MLWKQVTTPEGKKFFINLPAQNSMMQISIEFDGRPITVTRIWNGAMATKAKLTGEGHVPADLFFVDVKETPEEILGIKATPKTPPTKKGI